MENNYLARWLNAEITDTELKELIGESEFKAYQKIKLGINQFKAPKFNGNALLNNIKAKTTNKKVKVISLIPGWVYSAAASVVLLFAAYFFFFSNTNYTTNFGQQSAFNLKDGSFVRLNAKSNLSYNKRTWAKNRMVNLNGEAYFEVKHGNVFTVNTKIGNIKVLGTHFDVKTGKNYLKVTCFKGKVEVTINNKKTILTKSQVFQFHKNTRNNWNVELKKPSWISGIYSYKNTPLFIIIKDLENQFNLKIENNDNINREVLLTASFGSNDKNIALKSIFVPLNFNFFIKKNKIILSKK